MTVGDKLREILKSNGMRQKDLADSLHVSESTVQKWIVNKNAVPADRIPDLSQILNISPLVLLGMDSIDDNRENYLELGFRLTDYAQEHLPICSSDDMDKAKYYFMCKYWLKHDTNLSDYERSILEDNILWIGQESMGANLMIVLDAMNKLNELGQLFEKVCKIK